MAKLPAGSSLLFGALADSGQIKQRKNGSYRMVLKGIDEIDWFTGRPDRVAGEQSPKKLVKEWDVLFSDGAPNTQATFEVGSKRQLATFEMFKPKLSDSNQALSFKVRGIGEKNQDLLTGLRNKRLSDPSLFIDDGTTGDQVVTMTVNMSENPYDDDGGMYYLSSLTNDVVFAGDTLSPKRLSGYSDAELNDGVITFINKGDGSLSFEVTLKNGVKSSEISLSCYAPSMGRPLLCGTQGGGLLDTPISYEIHEKAPFGDYLFEVGEDQLLVSSGSFDTSKQTSIKSVTWAD